MSAYVKVNKNGHNNLAVFFRQVKKGTKRDSRATVKRVYTSKYVQPPSISNHCRGVVLIRRLFVEFQMDVFARAEWRAQCCRQAGGRVRTRRIAGARVRTRRMAGGCVRTRRMACGRVRTRQMASAIVQMADRLRTRVRCGQHWCRSASSLTPTPRRPSG